MHFFMAKVSDESPLLTRVMKMKAAETIVAFLKRMIVLGEIGLHWIRGLHFYRKQRLDEAEAEAASVDDEDDDDEEAGVTRGVEAL